MASFSAGEFAYFMKTKNVVKNDYFKIINGNHVTTTSQSATGHRRALPKTLSTGSTTVITPIITFITKNGIIYKCKEYDLK